MLDTGAISGGVTTLNSDGEVEIKPLEAIFKVNYGGMGEWLKPTLC